MRTPSALHHVRLTSRTFWTSWVSATTSVNRCRPDGPNAPEGDRRAYHKCVDRPDISCATDEVSMTLASPKRCGLPRWRRFDRYLLVTQKLGILIRQCNDPEHLEDVDYNQQKEHFGWNTQDGISDIERVRNRSELSNVIERRERVLRCGDNDGRGTARPTTPGILWCRPLKHIETKLLWLQAKHEERNLTVVKEPTQTNTAHGFTKVLRTVTDTTTVTMSRPASEKRLQSQDDGHESMRCMRSHAQC